MELNNKSTYDIEIRGYVKNSGGDVSGYSTLRPGKSLRIPDHWFQIDIYVS